jgi:holo-[acyl-carrier protein] synthase
MMEVGIDIEDVKRFRLKRSHHFLRHAFAEEELEYAFSKKNPAIHLCGFFCAKEAAKKALCPASLLLREIRVSHTKEGKPIMSIAKKAMKGRWGLKVSISHTPSYATAVVIAQRKGK